MQFLREGFELDRSEGLYPKIAKDACIFHFGFISE
jgi:hypothetical protein